MFLVLAKNCNVTNYKNDNKIGIFKVLVIHIRSHYILYTIHTNGRYAWLRALDIDTESMKENIHVCGNHFLNGN